MEIQTIDITQIIVAIITTAGVVYSALQNRKQQEKQKKEVVPQKYNTWTIGICIGVILLVGNLGVLGWRFWGYATTVEITYPDNSANTEIREMVRGTAQKIPKGRAIWVVVYPYVAGRYHPQNDPADVQVNGDWASLTFIGIEGDVGSKFDIIAVLADKNAQDAFNTYLTQAKDTETWSGLEKLPEGAEVYNRVTVTRK